jgi:hypothetical protein
MRGPPAGRVELAVKPAIRRDTGVDPLVREAPRIAAFEMLNKS